MSVSRANELGGVAGVVGGFAPLDSGLLIPMAYLPQTGAWTSFTPTLTASSSNPTLGNSVLVGAYKLLGSKTAAIRIHLVWGSSGTAVGSGTWRFALPPGMTPAGTQSMSVHVLDSSNVYYSASALVLGGVTYVAALLLGSVVETNANPFTPASGDEWAITGIIEIQ